MSKTRHYIVSIAADGNSGSVYLAKQSSEDTTIYYRKTRAPKKDSFRQAFENRERK